MRTKREVIEAVQADIEALKNKNFPLENIPIHQAELFEPYKIAAMLEIRDALIDIASSLDLMRKDGQ